MLVLGLVALLAGGCYGSLSCLCDTEQFEKDKAELERYINKHNKQ